LALLVRTWNVFHGNANPPERRGFLEEMVRLATADGPDVLCLQELPVWALRRLDDWSGMRSFGAVAARPLLGSAELGHLITQLHHGLFRSAVAGQANAILLARQLRPLATDSIVLNPLAIRRAQAKRLRLDRRIQLAWATERRVCHAVRAAEGDRPLTVANLHDSSVPDWRVPDAELLRAAVFADSVAEPADVLVLAGDFNVIRERSKTLEQLTSPEWGFSRPISGIDQILVRGARSGPAKRWPDERRRVDGRLLSDHAPVEVTIE
jgi:endonuclease/exonuclease/phosphatase family metal-dependent hydrolase